MNFRPLIFIAVFFSTSIAFAKETSNFWQSQHHHQLSSNDQIKVSKGHYLQLNFNQLQQSIISNGNQTMIIDVPLPNGIKASYRLNINDSMSEVLASKFPDIRTYTGVDINNEKNRGSFAVTQNGFTGFFKHNNEWVVIDPVRAGNQQLHVSYYRQHAIKSYQREADKVIDRGIGHTQLLNSDSNQLQLVGTELRTYRLAVSASAEYTTFHSSANGNAPNVADGLAAIVTVINRVNEIYQRDLSKRFTLVANNDQLIFTDPNTDPFNNSSSRDLSVNATTVNNIIGEDNYDIGHLMTTGGGGVAVFGVCESSLKAQGLTGLTNPVGDVFFIDYVSHELGHQFGANHTFNGTAGACGSSRSSNTAWEPGSGTSILSYAGICGSENIQNNSDAMFHIGSIQEILAFTSNPQNTCGTVTPLGNAIPVVNAGSDTVVPAATPIILQGSATDSNNDSLTFSWEQLDLGNSSSSAETITQDDGTRPLFRAFLPSDEAVRYLPRLSDTVAQTSNLGEALPTTNRIMTFRLTVRDGRGGVSTDERGIQVVADAGPFVVIYPSSTATINVTGNINWQVANTNIAPVNCSHVDILLSTDSGQSFDTMLVSNTVNDGEETIVYSGADSNNARVMVRCSNHAFFTVNAGDFSIVGGEPPPIEPVGLYDIDGNGRIEALNDGLLIVKYFFGIRGEALVSGSIGDNATRSSAAQVESYFQSVLTTP